MIRSGLIMKKIGMTGLFSDNGKRIPVTVLQLDGATVVCHRTKDKDGYCAIQVGVGKGKNLNRSQSVYYDKIGVEPKRKVFEFRLTEDALPEIGQELSVDHFIVGQYVDIIGCSLGKGFAGGMKRHNFGGLRATHGVSLSHRSIGSTGNRTDPGRTFKNRKMPGQLGSSRVTVQNLEIIKIDSTKNLIFIRGSVPGHDNNLVLIRDAKKKSLPDSVRPFVTKDNCSIV